MPSLSALNYHSGLSDRPGDDHKTHSPEVGNQTKKTRPFIGSVTRKTQAKAGTSGLGVKPYVSKREKEKIAQENALVTASAFSTNHRVEEIDCAHSLKGVELKFERKIVFICICNRTTHAVQFGNNWMKKTPRTAKIGRGRRPSPFWLSEECFGSNYF